MIFALWINVLQNVEFKKGKICAKLRTLFLFIVKQVGIINDIFPERILSTVTSDDP